MASADETPTPSEVEELPARPRVIRRASLDLKEQAMFASKSMRRLSMEMQDFDTNLPTVQPSINEESVIDGIHLKPEKSILLDMDGMEERTGDRRSSLRRNSSMSDSMRHLQMCMDAMEIVNAANAKNMKSAELSIDSPSTPSYTSKSMKKSQQSLEEMERLNAENENKIEFSPNPPKRMTSVTERVSRALGESPTAKRVLNSLRRFRSRTDSSGSIDTEHSALSAGSSIDVDLHCQTQEEQDSALEILKKQAYESCLDAIREHLFAFLAETPSVTYEEWIEELHPENAKSMPNMVRGKRIDHRFYMDASDHRKLWNEHLCGQREFVPVRKFNPDDHEAPPNLARAKKSFNRGQSICNNSN